MKQYHAIVSAMTQAVWAILPAKADAICAFLSAKLAGETLEYTPTTTAPPSVAAGIAVLPLHGMITSRSYNMEDYSGGVSSEQFGRQFDEAMANDGVGAIVIDIDSPGGMAAGTPELSRRIYAARGNKPIYAIANHMAASAAYYIGTAADSLSVTPSGEVGSIGVVTLHTDYSGMDEQNGVKRTVLRAAPYKAEGNPFEPLGDEAAAYWQGQLEAAYDTFLADVARNRGETKASVAKNYGQGRMLLAKDAMAAGMVDKIETLDELLARVSAKLARGRTRQRQRQALALRSR